MELSTISERIKAVRKHFGMSQRDFADGIYLSHSFFAKIETGTRAGNHRVYELISNRYKVNKKWLLTGKGTMFDENQPDPELLELLDIMEELDPIFKACIIQQVKLMANLHRMSQAKTERLIEQSKEKTESQDAE